MPKARRRQREEGKEQLKPIDVLIKLLIRIHVPALLHIQGAMSEAKVEVEEGKEQLESMEGVDPSVSAAVYFVASLLYKAMGDSAEFYRSRWVCPCLKR